MCETTVHLLVIAQNKKKIVNVFTRACRSPLPRNRWI